MIPELNCGLKELAGNRERKPRTKMRPVSSELRLKIWFLTCPVVITACLSECSAGLHFSTGDVNRSAPSARFIK